LEDIIVEPNINSPKVFVSYSWAVERDVLEIAERLVNDSVDIILDKWDLKEGQDKYVFMEQAVNNPEITRVLIFCDKTYAQKANDRIGGAGDETVIISPEIYGNVKQEKFVPIILEKDENGKPYLPIYLKSRIYIDLTGDVDYEKEYDKLLRNLFGKQEYIKPKLGNPPEWLNEENVNLSVIRSIIKQLKGYNGGNSSKADFLTRKAIDEFSQSLKSFGLPLDKPIDVELLLKRIDATKLLRDYFIDYIDTLISKDMPIGEIASDYFENLFNNVTDARNLHQWYPANLEFYYFFIWESFVCTIAVLLHYEKYKEINNMLSRTYFLIDRISGEEAYSYEEFKKPFEIIENVCKPNYAQPNLYTLAGEITVKREKKPLITKETLSNADLFLYQMSYIFGTSPWKWFPILYIYRSWSQRQSLWKKLQSKKYCEKLFPLFGVNNITDLKNLVCKSVSDKEYRYSSCHYGAPGILASIKIDEIGILN
jgi:hypothetical protein